MGFTGNRAVAQTLEERIDALEREKLVLAEKATKVVPSEHGWRNIWN